MNTAKVAISISRRTLERLDHLVKTRVYANRSRAIEDAVEEKLRRLERRRLFEECAKLNPVEERSLAEEGLSEELKQWPEY
ncbi:MAG: ribbon-helix-helix domain-containing protein [Dehalococcoidia bacterium]|nr:ribbon-helix-helix domain-containing protein [Dehalococcoidia bacterium]